MPYSAIEVSSRVYYWPLILSDQCAATKRRCTITFARNRSRKHKASEVAVIADSSAQNQLLLLAILIEILLEFACPVRNESVGIGTQL